MASESNHSPFVKSNPLYAIATEQNFSNEKIEFKPIIDVLELLFGNMALGNFFINVIDFRDYTYPYNSPNSLQVVGYTKEEIGDINWLVSVVHPDDHPIFMDYTVKVLSYIQALPIEQKKRAMINHCFRIRHGVTKEFIWIYQQHHMSYIDKNGSLVYTISLVTDVTHLTNQTQPTWSVTERLDDGTHIYHIGSEMDNGAVKQKKPLLTNREKEVVNLSARGFQTREISKQLGVGYQTVLTYKKNILKKTKSRNMPEAVAYAINLGYL